MKNNIHLSIVIPSYNQKQYIKKTLSSILLQNKSTENIELIIVDALSTDGTFEVIKSFLPRFKKKKIKVTFIHEKDKGQADAINKGWRVATGEILAFLNSDDYYENETIEKVIKYFSEHKITQWAYGGWNIVDKHGNIYKKVQPKSYKKSNLLNYCNIGQPSCFFRRNLLGEFGHLKEELHLAMDYDLWLRFATKYEPGIIPHILSNMRYYKEAKSGNKTISQQWEMLRLASTYSNPISFKRFWQYFYFLRGLVISWLHLDITRRVEKQVNDT